ncbi:MAG: MmcQ/YjbR family DNA-binding protein, partial [Candidatus Dormiibacterota bacterium]
MTSPEHARRLALDLPEALEQDHHGRPSFRVGGRIFATLWDPDHLNVMLDEPAILAAVQGEPSVYAPFRWGKRLRAVQVNLGLSDPSDLAELLTEAWEQKAPRRLTTGRRRRRPTPRAAPTIDATRRVQSLYVTVGDGVRLAVDVWLPVGRTAAGGRVSTIVRATRYHRADA